MSIPGNCWRHGIVGTRGAWLPGDAGDSPTTDDAIEIPAELRATIGVAFRDELLAGHEVLAIAVTATHCRFLAWLPVDDRATQSLVDQAKRR